MLSPDENGDGMGAYSVTIVIRGRLGPDMLLALDGFRASTDPRGMTTLVGRVPDQARLLAVLALLDSLRAEIFRVTRMPESVGAAAT